MASIALHKCMLLLGLVCIASVPASAKNILFFPLHGEGSHYMVMENIADNLVKRGHNATMLIGDIFEHKVGNSREKQIDFIFHRSTVTYKERIELIAGMTNAGLNDNYTAWTVELSKSDIFKRYAMECQKILGDVDLITKLRKFDLAVVDNNQDCMLVQYLRVKYGIMFVSISAIQSMPAIDSISKRLPFNPSYMPELTSAMDHHMTFSERLLNVGKTIVYTIVFTLLKRPSIETIRDFDISKVNKYYENAELFLINNNFALDFARPLLPNAIPVGGLSTKPALPLSRVSTVFISRSSFVPLTLCTIFKTTINISKWIAFILKPTPQ